MSVLSTDSEPRVVRETGLDDLFDRTPVPAQHKKRGTGRLLNKLATKPRPDSPDSLGRVTPLQENSDSGLDSGYWNSLSGDKLSNYAKFRFLSKLEWDEAFIFHDLLLCSSITGIVSLAFDWDKPTYNAWMFNHHRLTFSPYKVKGTFVQNSGFLSHAAYSYQIIVTYLSLVDEEPTHSRLRGGYSLSQSPQIRRKQHQLGFISSSFDLDGKTFTAIAFWGTTLGKFSWDWTSIVCCILLFVHRLYICLVGWPHWFVGTNVRAKVARASHGAAEGEFR